MHGTRENDPNRQRTVPEVVADTATVQDETKKLLVRVLEIVQGPTPTEAGRENVVPAVSLRQDLDRANCQAREICDIARDILSYFENI